MSKVDEILVSNGVGRYSIWSKKRGKYIHDKREINRVKKELCEAVLGMSENALDLLSNKVDEHVTVKNIKDFFGQEVE